jgi:WD40 repeat protein
MLTDRARAVRRRLIGACVVVAMVPPASITWAASRADDRGPRLRRDITVVEAAGFGAEQDDRFLVTEPEWASDGRRLVFAGGIWPDLDVIVLDTSTGDTVRLFRSDSTDYMPSWSPDGLRIVFSSTRSGTHDLYIGTTAGGAVRRLTIADSCDNSEPRWSPDGDWIAYRSDCDGNREIHRIRPDGSGRQRVTSDAAEDSEPSWSPDGRRLLFTSMRDGQPEVYVIELAGGAPVRLTHTPGGHSRRAEWSPDGEWIAFGTDRDGNEEIYLMRRDGSGLRNVSLDPAREYYSRWHPGGGRVVFTSNRERRQNAIYETEINGGGVRRLFPPSPDRSSARERIRAALAAMGGANLLSRLRSLRLEGMGHYVQLDQPDTPAGPWPVQYFRYVDSRDVQRGRQHRQRISAASGSVLSTMMISDGVVAFRTGDSVRPGWPEDAVEAFVMAPERVLPYAEAAPDLRSAPDTVLRGVSLHSVLFTRDGVPIRLYLNASTSLPMAVEWPRPTMQNVADVSARVWLTGWIVEPGGLGYPRRWEIEQGGEVERYIRLFTLERDVALADSLFAIPENAVAAYRERWETVGHAPGIEPWSGAVVEVAPGIVQLPPEAVHATIVRQEDGLVILDAPVLSRSQAYPEQVIDRAGRQFPGLPVKAVLTTAYTRGYYAGVRAWVARGVPVYVLDRYVPAVRRLVDSPYRTYPDALARQPREPEIRNVTGRIAIGNGSNRLELYDDWSTTGRLVAYFPEHRLLYASDLHIGDPTDPFDGRWLDHFVAEIVAGVRSSGIAVERAFSLHMSPFDWRPLEAAFPER